MKELLRSDRVLEYLSLISGIAIVCGFLFFLIAKERRNDYLRLASEFANYLLENNPSGAKSLTVPEQ